MNIRLLILVVLIHSDLIAQDINDRILIRSQTNVEALNKISEKANNRYTKLVLQAKRKGINNKVLNSKNRESYLSGFDTEGNPVYDSDDNVNSAITARIDKIWDGGSSGLNLDGSGVQIGHWEAGGIALLSHQELVGKVTHAEDADITGHATHTACTMVGLGVDSAAKGMASGATITSRRSDNDESEIANFAANGGILSNHSYKTGDSEAATAVYGAYTSNSKKWDDILYNAPYLTLCKSGGNDRGDGINVNDNGYDLIFTVATSKNLITVGAIDDVITYYNPKSITQSSFGSWGPTDDWRIKPDITANGVRVYSAYNGNDTDYTYSSGTSMSTPSVTGAIALLQQHYHNKNSAYMKAATVKALLIGTTDEVGDNNGPDFQSGWGLLNAARAAEVISNNGTVSRISELSLLSGSTYTTTIEVDGISPLTLAIAWTDPSGHPVSEETDNQTLMLINDLDVKITGKNSVYEPWVMTPNSSSDNFTDAATKGDNYRDNVERIDVSSLPPGVYTVSVTHKRNLVNGSQDFSMIINGLSPNTLGMSNIEDYQRPRIFPNPSKGGNINISIPDSYNSDKYQIEVFDIGGRKIKSSVHFKKQINLSLPNVDSGLFIIKVQINQNFYNQLIIIEN